MEWGVDPESGDHGGFPHENRFRLPRLREAIKAVRDMPANAAGLEAPL